ncbi:MAG TPA: hypothetical protein VFA32_07665 [Dehalococcoidia bacterium]|jgi:hypothetical protein|nr:hypothetical protein [Dehalococcoidia bacterium]
MDSTMNGRLVPPTAEELDQWRSITEKATPGPWSWNEDKWNARYPLKKGARRRFVYALQGPNGYGDTPEDRWSDSHEYPTVMRLQWHSVKGDTLVNVTPNPDDRAFIAEARSAMPRQLDYVAALEQEIARLKE